jgi:hypothetical protein
MSLKGAGVEGLGPQAMALLEGGGVFRRWEEVRSLGVCP